MKFFKNRKFLMIVGVVAVFLIAGFFLLKGRSVATSGSSTGQRTQIVAKGTLSITLTGSGSVIPTQREEILNSVNGAVKESFLEEGKTVKAGDILLTLDDTDAQLALKKLENSIKLKEVSAEGQSYQDGALLVTAPGKGRVAQLNVKEGDSVNKDMALMTLVDEETFRTRVTFENASTSQFKDNKSIQVQIPEFMTAVSGKIQSLAQDGSNVYAVIDIDNPGALEAGMSAYAEVETPDGSLLSTQGILEAQSQVVIKAEAAGTIAHLSVSENQKVSEGKLLLSITGEDLAYTLEGEQLDLEQSGNELEAARENLENYVIRAPFDGILTSVSDVAAGDTVKPGDSLGILINQGEMSFDVSIDELDIASVEIGQKVFVTVEALEETTNEPIEGKVTSIALEGSSSNGVTSYPVTITIPGRDKLKSGMNVDAVIQVKNKENALLIPIEAVQKRGSQYYVYVKREQQAGQGSLPEGEPSAAPGETGGTRGQGKRPTGSQGTDFQNMTDEEREAFRQRMQSEGMPQGALPNQSGNTQKSGNSSSSNYYDGAVPVVVTIGDHNETSMEILEGLNEGDIIVLPQLVSNSSTAANSSGGLGFGMGGGMGIGRAMSGAPEPNRGRDDD